MYIYILYNMYIYTNIQIFRFMYIYIDGRQAPGLLGAVGSRGVSELNPLQQPTARQATTLKTLGVALRGLGL